jgi:hypothetical protein
MGAPADVLAQYESEDDDGNTDDVTEIEVLECNWNAVQVFTHVEPQWIVGLHVARAGISAAEIRAAVTMLRVPRAEWPQIISDVRFMGKIAQRTEANKRK